MLNYQRVSYLFPWIMDDSMMFLTEARLVNQLLGILRREQLVGWLGVFIVASLLSRD
jgi:hypothetical protein